MLSYVCFFIFIFLWSCGGPSLLQFPEDNRESPDEGNPFISSIEITGLEMNLVSPLILEVGSEAWLSLTVVLSTGGRVKNVTSEFNTVADHLDTPVLWFSNNNDIVSVNDSGKIEALQEGLTNVKASLWTYAENIDVIVTTPSDSTALDVDPDVEEDEDEEEEVADYFLSSNDDLDITYGVNAGFASHLFPGIIYGVPRTGGTHVVSFGGGGSLWIELNNYIIVDGPGVDFTIFENAIHSDLYGIFAERAQVSVSEDGVDFVSFPCDVFDPDEIYEGCAGVTPVNALQNPLNPEVSGGDSFDLSDIGVRVAKYILIEDLNTCLPGDPTYLTAEGEILCGAPGQQGFDLDAMAIINGRNE